ncbi:Protein N-acetyltransferase, RimJ/RimL family [Devosia crocina]|uniref:Protein N-acetyltransferase, RimJ/RimL family n=1 Tax=Devosia crocina TaxID=429728 RepID=A0A1I7NDL5_9HYPH|nr:GNAT family N-acetyltransferase [Devosia crocina]SFV32750.1 Protein N-acetyltransferase, RimJ/RimL family [Devosia crocina]
MTPPTIETRRLILRPMCGEDLAAYAHMMASPRAIYMGGPFNALETWRMFCQDIALWSVYGHGGLMIDRKSDRRCVGQVGINHGPLYPEKELGWLLYEGFEGCGYATEAGAALRDWAFGTLGISTLVSYFDPANHASMAVSARLGGVIDNSAQGQDEDDVVFRYPLTSANHGTV